MRVLTCAAVLWLLLGPAAQGRPFTVEDALHLASLGKVVVAPGGRWVIIEKRRPYDQAPRFDNDTSADIVLDQLWAADLVKGGPAAPLFPQAKGVGYLAGPISPSGSKMLVYRVRGYRFDAGVAEFAKRTIRWLGVTPELAGWGRSAVWRGDDQIVLIENPRNMAPYMVRTNSANMQALPRLWRPTIQGTGASIRVLGSGAYLQDHPRAALRRLLLVDPRTGGRRELARGDFVDLELATSGRYVAVLSEGETMPDRPDRPLRQADATRRTDLALVDLETGVVRRPCPELDLARSLLTWSPSRDALLVFGRKPGEDWEQGGLLQVEGGGGPVKVFTGAGVRPLLDFTPYVHLLHVHADWLGDAPAVYGTLKAIPAVRPEWYRLTPSRAETLSRDLRAPPPDLAAVSAAGDVLLAEDSAWRLGLDGRLIKLAALPKAQVRRAAELSAGPRISLAAPRDDCLEIQRTVDAHLQFDRVCISGKATAEGALPISVQPIGPGGGGAYVGIRRDAQGAQVVFLGGGKDGDRRILGVNAQLASVDFADLVRIHHLGPKGEALTSWLYLPRDRKPGVKLPVVVIPYPGVAQDAEPYEGQAGVAFMGVNPQLVVGQGYAALIPSLPRSGEEPAAGLADQILQVVDAAGEQAPVDIQRLAIWGHSFGGYAVLVVATQTNRFKAAIAEAAPTDLAGGYGAIDPPYRTDPELTTYRLQANMGWSETGQGGLGAVLWDAPERYLRNSPLFAANRIVTPVMLIQGDQDIIDVGEGEKMFNALYRQNKDAVLLTYWGENHTVSSPPNVRDKYRRAFAFLRDQLGPAS
ncbi:S9 family peptidase [Caulobacter sp. S45]|uniref:alpha/beta hydrolase family protein n=1 Tax=Caulobacter sp. S45 TaxID=1641861 RepID=UPI00131ABEEC|nr:prolyl oligopeptidase family serine peptidase [Caulobacter sp. S45]